MAATASMVRRAGGAMDEQRAATANPPIELAVAVWVGMPDDEIARGLAEGWIRRPEAVGSADAEANADADGETTGPSAATLRGWLARLDPTLDGDTFEGVWHEAGTDDRTRGQALSRFVAQALGLDAGAPVDLIDARVQAFAGDAQLLRLAGRSGTELEALARADAGVRRALAEHSPWALRGDRRTHASADALGRFDRFDPDSGEPLISDAWLADRARHATWRLQHETAEVTGDGWRFVDRAAPEATVEVAGAAGRPLHQVVFARDGGDAVTGGATTDRIHGGDGDDLLRGRAGDDRLECNGGDDALAGGAGRDELDGGRGDDELDGGAGSDRLAGGAGRDELVGGRDNDVLRGGAGDDVYLFAAGDGVDVVDDDGGVVQIDDVDVAGTMQRDGERWRSPDGRWHFEHATGPGGGVLRITHGDGDGIELRGWQQGRYGITLEGLEATGEGDVDAQETSGPARGEVEERSPRDAFGNEGSDGHASDAGSVETAMAAEAALHADDDGDSGGSWVDWRAVEVALAPWHPPVPPDVPLPVAEAAAPTLADIADAGADAAGGDDGTEAIAAQAWTLDPMRSAWRDGAIPMPPDLVLRRTA
jgi:hypothetical protein